MTAHARQGRGRRLVVTAVLTVVLVGSAQAAAVQSGGPASPPPQPPPGTPGGNGHCELSVTSVRNPRQGATLPVWVFEPTGAAPATVTGGRCDGSERPAVFIAHGFGLTDPAAYQDLIDHLVSVGNVVVYPAYDVKDSDSDGDVDRLDLEESHRVVADGIVAAVAVTPRIDTSRVGWWGHSHGGGMVPWLVQQGAARRWGTKALWMSNISQAYSQLVGAHAIRVPARTQAMTIAFEDDAFADKRLGMDVFESLTVPAAQKRHVMVRTDVHGQPTFGADHFAPAAGRGQANAVDFLLWRYADLLETCALSGRRCGADLSAVGSWSDRTPIVKALVSRHPVDSGPIPAILAECDSGFASGLAPSVDLNPRRQRCGPSHI